MRVWPFRDEGEEPAGEAKVRPRRPLAHGIAFNLATVAVQVVLALVAVPLFARELGAPRMGVLALVWTTIGYFSLLNLGVGRALIHSAAGQSEEREVAQLVWTSLLTVGAVAALAALVLEVGAPLLVAEVLNVPPAMRHETATAFHVLALALPFVVSMPVLSGALEARYRFGTVSAVTTVSSTLSYLAPLLVLHFTDGLVPLVVTLGAVRIGAWCTYLTLCFREVPALRRGPAFERERMGPLLRFGGWTTVSAVVSPLMGYLDRFVVAGMVSAAAVAYYAMPQEAVLRLGAVSGSVVAVLFPAFSAARAQGEARLRGLMERGVDVVFVLVFPLSLLLATFGREGLGVWLGAEYAAAGTRVLAWLAVGLLANGMAKVAAALLQGLGRPDVVARVHLVELPLYLAALAGLISVAGIEGAAIAWTLRVTTDGAALFWAALRQVPAARRPALRALAMVALGAAAALAGFSLPGVGWKAAYAGVLLGAVGVVGWRWFGGEVRVLRAGRLKTAAEGPA